MGTGWNILIAILASVGVMSVVFLAFLDKMQIAESLSQVAVTQIIGVVLVYGLKSAIENLSKNNHWPDKPTTLPTGTADVISDASGDGTTGVG